MKVITLPDQRLRTPSQPIDPAIITTKEFQAFVRELIATMVQYHGIGIAAPQVADLRRVIIVTTDDGPQALMNPAITRRSRSQTIGEEGCLSIPGVYGLVKRPSEVTVRYYDVTGKLRTLKASGMVARIIQHEVDHIDGVLFIDRMDTPPVL